MILDLFAGPGGWSEGLRSLGLHDIGLENDPHACATRAANHHATIRADVAAYPTAPFVGRVRAVVASPPCPTFSAAGHGSGNAEMGHLHAFTEAVGKRGWFPPPEHYAWTDPRTPLVLEPLRWVDALQPDWIALEQVPSVLPLWEQYAATWQDQGWSVWAGILNAADFGVPQTRRRAFLIANRTRPITAPPSTHCDGGASTLFGELLPWVSMADALGWGPSQPTPTLVAGKTGDGRVFGSAQRCKWAWPWTMPATTTTGDPRLSARSHHVDGTQGRNAKSTTQVRAGEYEGTEPIKLTVAEALTIQSFDPRYIVRGSKTRQYEQIGNAVPPVLARAVLSMVA